jgi:hypothetical protein
VYIQSFTCRNIRDSEDNFSSLHLIVRILEECHKIGLSGELKKKYQEKSKTLEKKRKIYSNVVRIWHHFLYRNDKHRLCGNQLEDLPSNLQHDKHVIEPALFLSGILVTTDGKLKRRLRDWTNEKQIKLKVASPEEAIQLLEEGV